MRPEERLLEIAQRLDEMSGDGASELQTLSNELGEIAEKWPQMPQNVRTATPPWVEELEQMLSAFVQRRAQRDPGFVERLMYYSRYGAERNYRLTDRMDAAMMTYASGGHIKPADAVKITGVIP